MHSKRSKVKKNKSSQKKCGGFTIAEVLVAVFISLLIILPTLSAFLMGRIGTEVSKHRTQAMNLIRSRLEYLQSQGYAFINSIPSGIVTENLFLDTDESGNSLPCTRRTVVTDTDGDDLLEVEVTVTWNERRLGSSQTVSESVMTLFASTRVFE